MLSVRIVCTNHYMSSPIAGLDVRYSEFRGTEVKQVPVIQIFGTTIAGQKTCLHVHGVFPYIYIPYEGSGSHARLMYQIASSLDKALNISFGNASSSTQHVYKVMLVSGRPFYGFHVKNHQYFKIYFYNPLVVKRAVELLQNGAILNKIYQPHEAHIPYILQFMIDYNLYGMSYIKVGNVMYRRDSKHTEALSNILEEHILPERINRMSTCELEADCVAADILNRRAITDEIAVNPGLAAIWEDEKQRRREEARSSQLTPQSSQQRPDRAATNSENYYMEKLFSKLASIELQDVSDSDLSLKISPEEERIPYPAETPEDCDLTEASFLDLHVHGSNSSTVTERTLAGEIEKTLVVDEDMVLSLSASYKDATIPSDTSVILNSQDMQLVEILEDMENGVEDDSILGSQQQEFGNQSSENAEDEENLVDLSQPLEPLCNTEDITAADSPLPDVESEEEVWDNTFWNEMEGNIPQLDGADDTPIKCRRKRLGVRGKVKQRCLIKGVNLGNEDININPKLDHIEDDMLNDKSPVIESSDIRSNDQDLRNNGQLQGIVLNGKSPIVPYASLSLDTHTPEVIDIESDDDDDFQNNLEMKNSDPILEEIPPDSDGLSAELFTDDFESFPLQENEDQESNFQTDTSNTYGQELRSNEDVEDYTENDGTDNFYIASNTGMPFKNVLIGDPSFTAQPCSSDGDDLIVEDSIVNVSWSGGNVSKSWITADKSLEVDIGSPLLAPYDSGGVQEISSDKIPHIDNTKIVEQTGPSPNVARRERRRCASTPKCYRPPQARKTTASTRSRKSAQKTSNDVQSDDPNTSELNLFTQNTANTVSDLSLIVDTTSDMLASTVLLPSCSIGSPSDELKRLETLLRQGDIEEIMDASCDSTDETLHRLVCKHSIRQQNQGKEIIEIVIEDSNTSENNTDKPVEATPVEEPKKLDQLPALESKTVDNTMKICEKVMQDILDTVEILALDIDKISTFTDHFENCRAEVEAKHNCSLVAAKETKIKKSEKKNQSLTDIADNKEDENSKSRNKVMLPPLAQTPKDDGDCKDNPINNNSFPAQDFKDDGCREKDIEKKDNQDSSFQLQQQQETKHSNSKNQIVANNNNIEIIVQLPLRCISPSKKHTIEKATNTSETELLAQETTTINSDVVGEDPALALQAQLYSLQTTSLSPRKLRSSSSETYSRKLARKKEKKKEKPNKLSLSSKKKTPVNEDPNTAENESMTNGLQQNIIESPIICRSKLSVAVARPEDHKLKSDSRASIGKSDIEYKLEDYNRNLRDSTKKASVNSARRSIRKLLDIKDLKNDTVHKNQENCNTDLNQNQKLDAVKEKHSPVSSSEADAYPAVRVKRKSVSTKDSCKRRCNQKICSSDKAEDDSSMIDTIFSCKENIVAIENIPVTAETAISTYLPLQHNELLNPKPSAFKVGIESKPLKSKPFRKRLKEQLLSDPVSKTAVEKKDSDKSINLAQQAVPNKQNVSYEKHKAVQISKSPVNISQQACSIAVPTILEKNVVQSCFIRVEKLKESVIEKFKFSCSEVTQSSKKKIKNIDSVGPNSCEQNVKSVKNRKSSSKRTASLQNSTIDLNENSQQQMKPEKIRKKEVKEQKQVHRNSNATASGSKITASLPNSTIDLNENSQQQMKPEKVKKKEVKEQKQVHRNSNATASGSKITASLPNSTIDLNENSQQQMKPEKVKKKEVKEQKQVHRNSNATASGSKITASLPNSAIDLNENSQQQMKPEKVKKKEVKEQKQVHRNSNATASGSKITASLSNSAIDLNENSMQQMKAEKIKTKEVKEQKQVHRNSNATTSGSKITASLPNSTIDLNENSQQQMKAEKIKAREVKKQKQVHRNSNATTSGSKITASLPNSTIDLNENSQQQMKAEKIKEREVKKQKQVHRNSNATASSSKRTASLQNSAIDLNENSPQEMKAKKVKKKEVKEQKQVCRNSDAVAGRIPYSSEPTKSKKRKLSETNNGVQIPRVAYETKEFGTVKIPKEALTSLKRAKVFVPLLKVSVPSAISKFKIKKLPILDGSADTSSSDDSVECNAKKPKKHTVTLQTLSVVRLSKQKKKENSNSTNKVAKARSSKERKSKPSASPRKTRLKTVLGQTSRESAYNPLDITIKKSPKKGVRNKRTDIQNTNRRRSSATSVIDFKSVESASGLEAISDIGAKQGVHEQNSVDAISQRENIPESDRVSDSRTVDQSSLHTTTTTSLKFINPHSTKRDTECRRRDLQLSPNTQTITSSISNTSSNVDNNSVNQSASYFQKNSEKCDVEKDCRLSVDTSYSCGFVNMDGASTSYPQNVGVRLEHNHSDKTLSERTARKRLQFPRSEPENRSGKSVLLHCSSDTKVNVQEVDSDISKILTRYPHKRVPEDTNSAEEGKEARKGTTGDAVLKHRAQPHEAFEYLEKMEHEDSDDDQDHGILSFYEIGLKSPDNINDTTILSTDSDGECQSNNDKPKKEKFKGLDTDSDSDSKSSSDMSKKNCEKTMTNSSFVEQVKIYTPLLKAPTRESILLSLQELDIPECVGQEPFVSDANDATKKKHIGNKTLQLCSTSVADLQDFTGGIQNRRGIEYWRNKLFHGFGPLSQMSTDQDGTDLNLKASLASQRKTIITPFILPPSVKDVELWLKAKELLRQKTDAEGSKEIKPKTKVVIMPMSPGQESVSDNEDVLSIVSCSPLTPKEHLPERSSSVAYHSTPQQLSGKLPSPHCTPISKTVKPLRLLRKDTVSASRRSSEATERSCNSPSLSTIAEDDEVSLSPADACLEDTLKLDSPSTEREDRLPASGSCCEEQSASKVIQRSQYRKLLTTPKHLKQNSGCQIEGSTPNNSHGFKMSLDNLQDARAVSEHQYLTILVMELHIQTRGDLRPDPTIDPIRALFYFIANDVPEDFSLPKESKGLIVVSDKSTHPDVLKQTASCHSVCYVPDEKSLFTEFVNLIRKWDPDILVGYEVEMLSWGYLFQRAFTLEINLCPQVSRVPGGKSNNQNPESNNSQSLDFSHDIRLPGRIVLNVWRLMRHEIALQSYTFESVMYHVLHQRIPLHSFKQLTLWWDHKTHLYRWICVDYYVLRVEGIYRIMQQLDLIERTSELARLFGIQFYEVLSRGSQFRVESMMLRLAKPLNYVPVSPSVRQRADMRAPEALPLIMEPQSGFYTDPLIVLDFQSLYPSIIIAYNYCFSTCLGRVEQLGQNEAFKFGCTHLKVSPAHLLKLKNDLNFSPAGVAFVKERIRKGILPRMLQEILDTRLMVKKSMKEHKDNKILQRVLHSRQLGLKLIANVTYGYTAANFSGRMPCIEVGDSVVSKGRETLHRAISLVQNTTKWNAQVVYGDTDSLFVLVPGRTREQAFKIGAEIAEAVTMDNPKPVKLKLEKVYQPCILQTKKRYVGYMYETPDQEKPVYEAKGIETVRRDGCPAVAKILEKSLKILFDTRDVSLVKKYVCRQFDKLIQGRINIQDLIFAKEYRGMKGYQPGVCIPALELTRRWLQTDKRAKPRVSERVPYVITAGPPGLPLIQLVRSPHELLQDPSLRINVTYYITRAIIPPLQRCFSLLGADVESWYAGMPRKAVTYLPAVVPEGLKKSTISHYFATTNCAVCDKQTHTGICSMCEEDPQSLAVTLENKLRQWERAYFNITKVCQSCCGRSESVECSSLDCPVLFRRNRALRDLDQGPFVRSILQQYLSF